MFQTQHGARVPSGGGCGQPLRGTQGAMRPEVLLRCRAGAAWIRGRLAEAFSPKRYKIDHVARGAIASASVYGALLGASAEEIKSAISMCVARYKSRWSRPAAAGVAL